jgi:hypothetical protein
MATEAATLLAEVLVRHGHGVDVTPIGDVPDFDPAMPHDPLAGS